MGGRIGRWLAIGLIAVVALVSLVLLAAHTPWARAKALAWASDFVANYHLSFKAEGFGYNALTRRVTLTDVRLAALGHEDQPFLTATRIEVNLPWSVYRRRFSIDHLEIDGGLVDIRRDAAGNSNLPPGGTGPPPETARRLDVRGITFKPIDVRYVDLQHDFDLTVPGIESELSQSPLGAAGAFAVRGRTAVRLKTRTLTLAPIEATMSFDGANVALKEARLAAAELNAVLNGTIHRVLDATSFELALNGIVNLAPATEWAPPPVPASGVVTIAGTIAGPWALPVVDLHVSGSGISIGTEQNLRIDGPVKVTMDAFSGEGLVVTPSTGGEIRAAFNVPWGPTPPSSARAEWQGLDAQSVFRIGEIPPQSIGAAYQGNGTFEFGDTRRYEIWNRAVGRAARGLAPITGQLHATLVGDDWTIEHAHQLPGLAFEGKTSGRINNAVVAATTFAGPAHARVSDVATAARSAATLGIDMPAIGSRIHGALDAPMTLSGSFRNPKVDTELSADALDVPLIGAVKASAHVVSDRRVATVTSIEARHGSSTITGDVAADITKRTWSGTLHASVPNAAEWEADVPEAWRLSGPVIATATLGGTFDDVQLDTAITGSAFTWAGHAFDGFTTKAIVTTDAIDASALRVTQGTGTLDGRLRYGWETGAYTANLKGEGLSWNAALLTANDTRATFSLQFDGSGTTARPMGRATSRFTITGGAAGALIDTGDFAVDLLGDQARFTTTLPSLGASITGDVKTSTPYEYRANAVLDRLQIARVAPLLGAIEGEMAGFVSAVMTGSGRLADDRDRVASVDLTAVDASVGGVAVRLNTPAKVSLRGDDLTLQGLDMKVGAGVLTASGDWNTRLDGTFQGHFTGEFQDAVRLGRAFGVPVKLDGTGAMSLELRSSGNRATTSAKLSVKGGTFNWAGGPAAVRNFDVDATLDGDALTVARASGAVATGGVVGRFSASGHARVPALDVGAIDGEITLDAAKFTFSGIPVEQQRPSRFQFAKGIVTAGDVTWLVADNPITLSGSVALASAPEPVLDLSVKGLVDLRVLSAFAATVAYDGAANVDAQVHGTFASPQLTGLITLEGAEVATSEPRLLLSDLSGVLRLNGQRVIVEDVHGSANGGSITISGPVDISGFTVGDGALDVQAQGVAMEFPAGLRSQVDALVRFNPNLKAPSVTGDVRASDGSYTDTLTLTSLARRSATPIAQFGSVAYVDRLRLNVSVATTSDASIDNNYGRFEVGAELRVVGTVAAPGMSGRVTMREGGQIYLAGRTFRLTRGDISFTDLRRIQPEFNIAAEASVGGVGLVTMTLTGTVEHPTFDLTSDDGSKTPGELAAALVGGGATAAGALTLLSGDLLGVTGRAIGLDALRLDRGDFTDSDFRDDPSLIANEADPATRLTIAKRLSDQVEVTLSQNLRESGKTTFIVSYFAKPNVEIRAISRDNATVGIGIRHQVTLGGTRIKTVRAEQPVISAITFVEATPTEEGEARSQIKLAVGDRLAFMALQRDIDRLRTALHGSGYFEARVRVRRLVAEDGKSVALEYRVERGPRTTLEIRGIALPVAERRALEAAWTSSVFDQFLIDDLTNRVRRFLLSTGELVSVVVGTVDRGSGTKRVRIEVTPGAPASSREIRFTGNQKLDAARLRSEVAAAGLEREAWLDPTLVERALRSTYASEGFLQATVTVEPLTFDGTVGVLPVTIIEGPLSTIKSVTWTGVQESRKALAVDVAKVEPGEPFHVATVSAARERVEDRYRADGFNAVEIELKPETQADASVALTFEVTEGPQQILQDVQTTGAEKTNSRVISGALKFEVGKPVNLDEFAKARKRLYDTNVFRQVDVEPVPVGDVVNGVQPVKAQIKVQEFPQWSLRYGVQLEGERTPTIGEFATSKNLGLVAEIKNPNLFGRALTYGLFGQYQFDNRDVTTYLSTSRLFGWPARSTLYGFLTRDRIRDDAGKDTVAVVDQSGLSAEQRWKTRGLQVVYGYRFERNRTFDPTPPPGDPFPLDFVANIARLSAATLFDHRDNPLDAHKGTFSSASWDGASPKLGSDVDNRKLFMQQYVFVPLGTRVVLASRVQSGLVFGPDDLLPSDRFRAGGATTVRGYGEDALGPRDVADIPSGGETLFVFNQELRFPIYRWLRGVAFVDAGNIFGRNESFSWAEIKLGYGAGFRFNTPVGLLRVDFGIPNTLLPSPTTREANSLKGGRWYFGLGHIF